MLEARPRSAITNRPELWKRVRELLRQSHPTAPTPPPAVSRTPPTRSTDEFFERLDAAFAQRVAGTRGPLDETGVVPTLDAVLNAPSKAPAESAVSNAAAPPVITDAQVDEVTRRVVERLGTRALRDVVADVVAEVAERLVREEIARIRNPR